MANLKELVGREAAQYVEDGMTVGLGTGSTVAYLLEELKGRNIKGVCTSKDTEEKAKEFGIEVVGVDDVEKIDLAIDGADEVDKDLNLIKGGGGALTREKIIDYKADRFIVIIDEGKKVELLGNFALPVEVLPFGWKTTKHLLEQRTGAKVSVRKGKEKPFVTDNGNYILDCKFDSILRPADLEEMINNIQGVVENGIFRNEKVSEVLVGTEKGVEVMKR